MFAATVVDYVMTPSTTTITTKAKIEVFVWITFQILEQTFSQQTISDILQTPQPFYKFRLPIKIMLGMQSRISALRS